MTEREPHDAAGLARKHAEHRDAPESVSVLAKYVSMLDRALELNEELAQKLAASPASGSASAAKPETPGLLRVDILSTSTPFALLLSDGETESVSRPAVRGLRSPWHRGQSAGVTR